MKLLCALAGAALIGSSTAAGANYLDDNNTFSLALSVLRSGIGAHPRVLSIEIEPDGIAIEAQDPHNPNHIDRWRYGTVTYLGVLPLKRLTGPEAEDPTLINPDLEANLFDLDSIDFSATPALVKAAIERAHLQDAAAVTGMEIKRRTYILPKPSSGDVRWTVSLDSGRERADIYANAQGNIVGADLSGTQRAKNLDLLKEPALVADAAASFRAIVGAGPVLTSVGVTTKSVGFGTVIRDQTFGKAMSGMPSVASFTWDLNGLQQRIGMIDINTAMGTKGPPPFSVDDVNWSIVGKLEQDALAKVAIAKSYVSKIGVAKSSEQPGGPALVWTVEITDLDDEVTSVVADTSGAIQRVILPESRRPKIRWLDPAALAGAIARVGSTFGQNASIASIVADDRRGRITIDDPSQDGKAATFDFSGDGVTRSGISFSIDSMGPRFKVADLAVLSEQKIAALEADAFKKIGGSGKSYLESVSIGAHPFVRQAGAHAIEVRLRNLPDDSAQAEYAWIVFDFNGRVLDYVTF